MLVANSVQEVMDFALIAQAATLRSRVPFLHIFDGLRTSEHSFTDHLLVDHHRNRRPQRLHDCL